MRLVLAFLLAVTWAAPAGAFDSLEIPKEAVRIDAMHPLPELRSFSLVEEKDMACMQDMAIAQCQRKVYTDDKQRLIVVFMGGAATYYWYFDPASKQASAQAAEGTRDDGFLHRDGDRAKSGTSNSGDYFSNAGKQGGGNVNLFKF